MLRFGGFFLLLTVPFFVLHAEGTIFPDVPQESWYASAVQSFLVQGYLDPTQPGFRGGEQATRAEFIKLIVQVNGGILDEVPAHSRFSDITPSDWFFGYIEEAAREGWVKGSGDCFVLPSSAAVSDPSIHPSVAQEPRGTRDDTAGRIEARCFVRPRDPISRAEAAVLLSRAFGKKPLARAPAFADNPPGTWFSDAMQLAADHCILRGDESSRNVRPGDPLNRAEMIVILGRIDEGKMYPECE